MEKEHYTICMEEDDESILLSDEALSDPLRKTHHKIHKVSGKLTKRKKRKRARKNVGDKKTDVVTYTRKKRKEEKRNRKKGIRKSNRGMNNFNMFLQFLHCQSHIAFGAMSMIFFFTFPIIFVTNGAMES
jgi:hypothetical protein